MDQADLSRLSLVEWQPFRSPFEINGSEVPLSSYPVATLSPSLPITRPARCCGEHSAACLGWGRFGWPIADRTHQWSRLGVRGPHGTQGLMMVATAPQRESFGERTVRS